MPEIAESRPFVEAAKPAEGTGRLRVALLTPGWGSSGYYSTDVCEAAGTDRIFTAGTHMYINHPTPTEKFERPVRDLTQLAAVLAEDAVWNSADSQLEADVITFSNWRAPLSEMAKHIGVSIRASADIEEGTAEGRDGPIVTHIAEALSVDFVTKAGRGGKVLEVVEDAFGAGRAAAQANHTIHEALNNDVRERLQDLVSDVYKKSSDSEYQYTWIRDFDADQKIVYFELEGTTQNGIFQQTYEADGDGVPTGLGGDAVEVRVDTSYVPVAAPSGQSTPTEESQEDTMAQIEEARLRVLEAAEARVKELQTEHDAAVVRAETAESALAGAAHLTAAATIVESVFDTAHVIGATATKSLVAKSFVLKEDGTLDEEKLKTVAAEAAAEISEARGQGQVHGVGGSATDPDDMSEEAFDAELARIGGHTVVKGA